MRYNNHQFNPNQLHNVLEDVFNIALSDLMGGTMIRKSPQANISENEAGFTIIVVAPGLEKSDFKVSVEDGKLNIAVDKTQSESNQIHKMIKNEWNFGQWKRSFKIDNTLDASQITATYELGVLTLELPKKEVSNTNVFNIEIK